MESLAAGVVAAAVAFVINQLLIRKFGNDSILTVIPMVEETLKTAIPVFLGTSIFLSHAVFGVVESAYETVTSRSIEGVFGGIVSLFSHLLWGAATMVFLKITASVILSIGATTVLHCAWNRWVKSVYSRRLGKP